MDAILFLRTKRRLCEATTCSECELFLARNDKSKGCGHFIVNYPEKAVSIMEEWLKENPVKTIMDDFFEKFPNAPRTKSNLPKCCPYDCGYTAYEECYEYGCEECWSMPLEEIKYEK